tara:strand:+ start:220 stop:831 length:612 start_codon:yes stop_codon:yes gene_type:complete
MPSKSKPTGAPAKAKVSRKKKTAASSAQAAAPPAPVVESAPVEPVAAAEAPVSDTAEAFTEFASRLQQVCSSMVALKSEFRTLEKRWNRELKAAQKLANKKKRKAGNRQPSGFVKPTLISMELATFLGKPKGTEMARTEVTREINKYIREHDLQDKANGRKINADESLSALLKLGADDELTYFNLQKYMSPHFAKGGVLPAGV